MRNAFKLNFQTKPNKHATTKNMLGNRNELINTSYL